MAYGPHERNILDVWRVDAAVPRPLAVMIHGGGWKGGDKRQQLAKWGMPAFEKLRAAGIHVASINYRLLSPEHPLPAPLDDAARAQLRLAGPLGGCGVPSVVRARIPAY